MTKSNDRPTAPQRLKSAGKLAVPTPAAVAAPIRTEAELRAALHHAERLMSAAPGNAEAKELNELTGHIERYERLHHSVDKASGREVLNHLMEANGLVHDDLHQIAPKAHIGAALSGKRRLSAHQISDLAKRFRVDRAAFLR